MTMPSTAATMPSPGSASPSFDKRRRRLQRGLVMDVQILVHQRFEIVRRDAADDDHLRRIGEEVDRVMTGEKLWVAREDRTLGGFLEMRLE